MGDVPSSITIARLDASQVDEAAGLLTRAFFDYPIWPWLVPDEARRLELMPWFMGMSLRYGLLADEAYATSGGLRAVAIWDPPTDSPIDLDPDGTRSGYNEMPQRMGAAAVARFNAMVEVQRPIRARVMGGRPFWYLPWLGVEPASQRCGAGTALLRDMFARSDPAGVPYCLETEKGANVRYYERHGFRVVAEGELPLGGPRFWTMRRDPPA